MNTNDLRLEYEHNEKQCRRIEQELEIAKQYVALLELLPAAALPLHGHWSRRVQALDESCIIARRDRDLAEGKYACAYSHLSKTSSYLQPLLAAVLLVVLFPAWGAIQFTCGSDAVCAVAVVFGAVTKLLWGFAEPILVTKYWARHPNWMVGVYLSVLLAVPFLLLLLAGATGLLSVNSGWTLLAGLVFVNMIYRLTPDILGYLI